MALVPFRLMPKLGPAFTFLLLSEEEYREWSEHYHAASVSMEDREAKVGLLCDELERDLRLLGAIDIEAELQDGVPETIADLKRAGIKMWAATGDKLETAIGAICFAFFVFVTDFR